jgi:hypothetical protein
VRVLCRPPSCGFLGLLVAHDGAHQLALELLRRCVSGQLEKDGVQAQVLEAAGHLTEAGTPVPHHQDGLAFVHERTDRVDGRLGLAGAGRAAHHQRVPCTDGVNHILLVGVGVEEQQLPAGSRSSTLGKRPGWSAGTSTISPDAVLASEATSSF